MPEVLPFGSFEGCLSLFLSPWALRLAFCGSFVRCSIWAPSLSANLSFTNVYGLFAFKPDKSIVNECVVNPQSIHLRSRSLRTITQPHFVLHSWSKLLRPAMCHPPFMCIMHEDVSSLARSMFWMHVDEWSKIDGVWPLVMLMIHHTESHHIMSYLITFSEIDESLGSTEWDVLMMDPTRSQSITLWIPCHPKSGMHPNSLLDPP